ncbi:MAG: ABC transporter permease [Aerococcaceae bacterium]|nr:ABC transporter permease [Aerococcaceae bacterium]
MQISEILKSSLATLKANGRRTFLTMIGIIIGIAAVITIVSLGNGFRNQFLDSFAKDEQGRRSQVFTFNQTNMEKDPMKLIPFKDADLALIEKIDGVDEVERVEQESNTVTYMDFRLRDTSNTFAVKPVEQSEQTILFGRNLTVADSQGKKPYIVIDETVAFAVFGKLDESLINRSITVGEGQFTVVGIFQADMSMGDVQVSLFPSDEFQEPFQASIPQGTYDLINRMTFPSYQVKVFFTAEADIKSANKQIEQRLKDNGSAKDDGTYMYFDMSEMMNEIGKTLNLITLFIGAVASISLFIAGVGVMNMMYISVSERTKEIGIRRSLGATQTSIQLQFLLEGIAITTLGGIIGYLCGMGIAFAVGNFLPFKAAVDIQTALISVVVSVAIGIVFSVFPAKAAARKNVVEILR